MKRMLALGTLLTLLAFALQAQDGKTKPAAKEALKELNDFIGQWAGNGQSLKTKSDIWNETIGWGWRFKGDDAWMEMTIKDGKHFKGGELRFLPDKKLYQLTAVTRDGKKQIYQGEFKNSLLRVERADPDTKETQRITMNTAADGVRFILAFERKPENRTLYTKDFQVACNREGESLATSKKKTVCVVSGGLGTIAVTFQGTTYYVCCSGCRDAFNENPKKYIDEFNALKGKK